MTALKGKTALVTGFTRDRYAAGGDTLQDRSRGAVQDLPLVHGPSHPGQPFLPKTKVAGAVVTARGDCAGSD